MWGIRGLPVDFPHKGTVTRQTSPFHDIMYFWRMWGRIDNKTQASSTCVNDYCSFITISSCGHGLIVLCFIIVISVLWWSVIWCVHPCSWGLLPWHCDDLTSSNTEPLFTSRSFIQAQIKENIKAPRHWPLWRECDRWIPRTECQ